MFVTFFKKLNGQIDEQVGFAKKIRDSDDQTCNIILDYQDRKVVKCVIEGKVTPTDFERMNAYYSGIYPDLINQLEKVNEKPKK
jgi:hypothetical protein